MTGAENRTRAKLGWSFLVYRRMVYTQNDRNEKTKSQEVIRKFS